MHYTKTPMRIVFCHTVFKLFILSIQDISTPPDDNHTSKSGKIWPRKR